ncbi:hypothetical protein RB195_023392 [Necator americanus]|uniref:Endonuclease/exonuclease/phosphatase domain-containing protein n=1 Tax=Necator americanus TaxID=51031 RepID=A0ABR1EIZ1_NECAM
MRCRAEIRPLTGSSKLRRSSTHPTFRLLGIGSLARSKPLLRFTTVLAKCRNVAPRSIVGRRPVVKAKLAVAWLLSLGKSFCRSNIFTEPSALGPTVSDVGLYDDRLCTYNTKTLSTDADLHALLGAAERIKFHVIALQETKCRRSDVREACALMRP